MKIGSIGAGNMGGAIAVAISKAIGADDVQYVSDADAQKASALAAEIGAQVSDNMTLARECDVLVLGVKPQVMPLVAEQIASTVRERGDKILVVSMAAGISLDDYAKMLGEQAPVIRIMPNTPVSVGEGMILWCAGACVSDEQISTFTSVMSRAGELDMIPEGLIDAAGCISGCGPAFVSMFIEALADGGVRCGVPRDKAMKYAIRTLIGTATLASETKIHPGALKDAVCSPGGTTIEGVIALENGSFRGDVAGAVIAAYEKTIKLTK